MEPVDEFADKLGLESEAVAFLHDLPLEVQTEIVDNFDSSGSKDGNVLGRLQGYARHLLRRSGVAIPASLGTAPAKERAAENGHPSSTKALASDPLLVLPDFARKVELTEAATDFLSRLPQDVLSSIIAGFDPSGTKDGNVWGRLLGYARSKWVRFLNLDQDHSSHIRSLPEEIQLMVMTEFDPHGSKDGRVGARLESFIRHIERRGAPPSSHGVVTPAAVPLSDNISVEDFSRHLRLDRQATAFMKSLPDEVASLVIAKFDPSGTKDGNVWGRLLGYVRHVWGKHRGVDQATIDRLRSMPEDEQMRAMAERPRREEAFRLPIRSSNRGTLPSVRQFAKQWSLNPNAEAFVNDLPQVARDAVLSGFDGRGTKDGNVWGRLLGYARQSWTRSLGLDSQTTFKLKSLPEEAQMLCMTTFDPSSSKDGNIGARLEGFMNRCLRQTGSPAAQITHARRDDLDRRAQSGGRHYSERDAVNSCNDLSEDPMVMEFLERCGLEMEAVEYLQRLPEDVLQQVLHEFDHTGTKDGNVLGRLQGYVRYLCRRRGVSLDAEGVPTKRLRSQ